MGRQLWMADVLRAAGLTTVEVSGWKTRGETDFTPEGLIGHETQGSRTSTDAGEINVMINGREGLAGPIAQLYLSRTGHWHVVTAGFSHHVKTGWGGLFNGLGNRRLLGVEAQHAAGEPWTDVQYRSYVRGVAAICKHTGWRVEGHKHHQPGDKSDPGFNMDTFRRDVAAVQSGDDMTPAEAYVQHVMNYRLEALRANRTTINIPAFGGNPKITETNELAAALARQTDKLDAIMARPAADVDEDALAAALAPLIEAGASPAEVAAAVREEIDKTKLGSQ